MSTAAKIAPAAAKIVCVFETPKIMFTSANKTCHQKLAEAAATRMIKTEK